MRRERRMDPLPWLANPGKTGRSASPRSLGHRACQTFPRDPPAPRDPRQVRPSHAEYSTCMGARAGCMPARVAGLCTWQAAAAGLGD